MHSFNILVNRGEVVWAREHQNPQPKIQAWNYNEHSPVGLIYDIYIYILYIYLLHTTKKRNFFNLGAASEGYTYTYIPG